jgi:hypothetical protein
MCVDTLHKGENYYNNYDDHNNNNNGTMLIAVAIPGDRLRKF